MNTHDTRVLTEKQAYDAMRRYLIAHAKYDWDVHRLILVSDYAATKADGSPWPNDPGEWEEWQNCVSQVLGSPDDACEVQP